MLAEQVAALEIYKSKTKLMFTSKYLKFCVPHETRKMKFNHTTLTRIESIRQTSNKAKIDSSAIARIVV